MMAGLRYPPLGEAWLTLVPWPFSNLVTHWNQTA